MVKYTEFTIREIKPEAGNKCYIRKSQGGWSPSIYGKPTDSECNVLSNCVGYACGRFAEIMNEIDNTTGIKYEEIGKHDAGNLITFAQRSGLEIGQTPKPGSIMCYGHAEGGYGSQGHVIMVEDVVNEKSLIISDSAYGGLAFRVGTATLNKNGTWKIYYTTTGVSWSPTGLQGFVYNPSVKEIVPEPEEPKFKIGDHVLLNGPLYKSAAATTASGYANNRDTHVTRYYAGGIHHYNTTGDIGWCDESSLTIIKEKYEINLIVGKGGTVDSNYKEAEEGTEIILNIKPSFGYELGLITSDGVEVKDNKFIMPDRIVNININFKKKNILNLFINFIGMLIKLIFGKVGK